MEVPTSSSSHNNSTAIVLTFGLGAVGTYYLILWNKNSKKQKHLKRLRKLREKERQEQFREFALQLPFDKGSAAIVALPFDVLVDKLQKRELKAKQVLEAYIAKTLLVTQEFNWVAQFIDKSIEWANELDALPEVKGPLHGVPICIKEDNDVEDMDSITEMLIYLNKPKAESAMVVKILQEAGAVPFCKTKLPQTTLSGSSDNPISGTTLNPINKTQSPGGSSSGTGCLVGAGGALFGLGSDIGDYFRLPSHCCGVSTFRSTSRRISGRGKMSIFECMTSVCGIIASKASTLAGVYRTVITDAVQNHQDQLNPIRWRSELFESKKPLRIGYLTTMPIFPSLGDTPDTILKAKEALEAVDHILIPFVIPDPWLMYSILSFMFTADHGSQTHKKLQFDEIDLAKTLFKRGRSSLSLLFSKLARIIINTNNKPVTDVEDFEVSKFLYRFLRLMSTKTMILDEMGRCELDVILMPVYPYPDPLFAETDQIMGPCCYIGFWNLLDFPAGVVPFGRETATKIDSYDDEGDYFVQLAKKHAFTAQGLPIGVQIVGKPFQEEVVLRVMTELEKHKPQE